MAKAKKMIKAFVLASALCIDVQAARETIMSSKSQSSTTRADMQTKIAALATQKKVTWMKGPLIDRDAQPPIDGSFFAGAVDLKIPALPPASDFRYKLTAYIKDSMNTRNPDEHRVVHDEKVAQNPFKPNSSIDVQFDVDETQASSPVGILADSFAAPTRGVSWEMSFDPKVFSVTSTTDLTAPQYTLYAQVQFYKYDKTLQERVLLAAENIPIVALCPQDLGVSFSSGLPVYGTPVYGEKVGDHVILSFAYLHEVKYIDYVQFFQTKVSAQCA